MNILDLIDANLAESQQKESLERLGRQREGYFWPSECSVLWSPGPGIVECIGSCARKVYWRFKKIPQTNPMEPGSIRTVTMGKAIEQQELDWYEKFGIIVGRNFKFQSPKYKISGEGDALVFDPAVGIVGVEVKSFYGYAAEKEIFGNKSTPGFPRLDNLLQTMYYLLITGIKEWRLVYITRTNFAHRQFIVRLVDGGFAEVSDPDQESCTVFKGFSIHDSLQRMNELYELIASNTLPACDFAEDYSASEIQARRAHGLISKTAYEEYTKGKSVPGDWQCSAKYCSYYGQCKVAPSPATAADGS